MRLSFLKRKLFAPLYASLTVLFVLLFFQEGLVLTVSILERKAVDGIFQTFKVKRESERLLGAALEEKLALHGYLLNNDLGFLEKYQKGNEQLYRSLNALDELLEDSPNQSSRIQEIKDFHEQWEAEFARPILENSLNLEKFEESSSIEPLRLKIDLVLSHELGVQQEHNQLLQRLEQLNQLSIVLSSLSFGLLIVGGSLNLWLIQRRVLVPLQKLIWVGNAWKRGELYTQIDHVSADDMGRLSNTLNGMAQDIRLRQGQMLQRNQQLEDLITTLSHDLRTPLLANRSTLDAIAGGAFGDISCELRDVILEYREANYNLIHLVETLLDVSRYEAKGSQLLVREPLNWQKICKRVSHWIQASSNEKCHLEISIAAELPQVNGDNIELQRVLQNLVDNAVRLSPESGMVLIKVFSRPDRQIEVAVQDQGPGLTEQESRIVFYRFAQGAGRQGRVGLGLYLCRQIIEAHGGKIWVDSILGQGATFRLTLPIFDDSSHDETTSLR